MGYSRLSLWAARSMMREKENDYVLFTFETFFILLCSRTHSLSSSGSTECFFNLPFRIFLNPNYLER